MAQKLSDKIFVNGGYLDANTVVSSISELKTKFNFIGQSIHMPIAFESVNEVPYPVDFWSTPNGEDVKWEIKTLPTIESESDLTALKGFIEDFKGEIGYFPIVNGFEFLVGGSKYVFGVNENDEVTFASTQDSIDDYVSDAIDSAIDEAET